MEQKPVINNRIAWMPYHEAVLWEALEENVKSGPVDYWKGSKTGNSIVDRKATWPIYNEKFEDLNKYSNGSHSKRLQGEKRLRRILNKKK